MEQLSFRKILRKEQDMAGKWRVWVEVSDNEAMILKFQKNPTDTEVKDVCLKVIDNRTQEEQSLNQLQYGTSNT